MQTNMTLSWGEPIGKLCSFLLCVFQGRGQRKVLAVHILDALVLNGTDIREKHFNER